MFENRRDFLEEYGKPDVEACKIYNKLVKKNKAKIKRNKIKLWIKTTFGKIFGNK